MHHCYTPRVATAHGRGGGDSGEGAAGAGNGAAAADAATQVCVYVLDDDDDASCWMSGLVCSGATGLADTPLILFSRCCQGWLLGLRLRMKWHQLSTSLR